VQFIPARKKSAAALGKEQSHSAVGTQKVKRSSGSSRKRKVQKIGKKVPLYSKKNFKTSQEGGRSWAGSGRNAVCLVA